MPIRTHPCLSDLLQGMGRVWVRARVPDPTTSRMVSPSCRKDLTREPPPRYSIRAYAPTCTHKRTLCIADLLQGLGGVWVRARLPAFQRRQPPVPRQRRAHALLAAAGFREADALRPH